MFSAAAALYAALTVIFVVLFFFLLTYLDQFPLVQIAFRDTIPAGWTAVTTQEQRVTLSVPRDWIHLEARDPNQRPELTTLLDAHPILFAVTDPLGAQVADLEIILVAMRDPTDLAQPFVVVAGSPSLAQLTLEEAERAALQADVALLQSELVENAKRSHLALAVEIGDLRCQQQFVPGRSRGMILAVCVRRSVYGRHINTIRDIQESFEYLKRDK